MDPDNAEVGTMKGKTLKECPVCGSRNYDRTRMVVQVMRHHNGVTKRILEPLGEWTFGCLTCGFAWSDSVEHDDPAGAVEGLAD